MIFTQCILICWFDVFWFLKIIFCISARENKLCSVGELRIGSWLASVNFTSIAFIFISLIFEPIGTRNLLFKKEKKRRKSGIFWYCCRSSCNTDNLYTCANVTVGCTVSPNCDKASSEKAQSSCNHFDYLCFGYFTAKENITLIKQQEFLQAAIQRVRLWFNNFGAEGIKIREPHTHTHSLFVSG